MTPTNGLINRTLGLSWSYNRTLLITGFGGSLCKVKYMQVPWILLGKLYIYIHATQTCGHVTNLRQQQQQAVPMRMVIPRMAVKYHVLKWHMACASIVEEMRPLSDSRENTWNFWRDPEVTNGRSIAHSNTEPHVRYDRRMVTGCLGMWWNIFTVVISTKKFKRKHTSVGSNQGCVPT